MIPLTSDTASCPCISCASISIPYPAPLSWPIHFAAKYNKRRLRSYKNCSSSVPCSFSPSLTYVHSLHPSRQLWLSGQLPNFLRQPNLRPSHTAAASGLPTLALHFWGKFSLQFWCRSPCVHVSFHRLGHAGDCTLGRMKTTLSAMWAIEPRQEKPYRCLWEEVMIDHEICYEIWIQIQSAVRQFEEEKEGNKC